MIGARGLCGPRGALAGHAAAKALCSLAARPRRAVDPLARAATEFERLLCDDQPEQATDWTGRLPPTEATIKLPICGHW